MAQNQVNYRHHQGEEIVGKFRQAWNGDLPSGQYSNVFSEQLVFHFQQQRFEGIEAYKQFVLQAKSATDNLDITNLSIFTRDDYVQAYFRWSSDQWHSDIVGGHALSNYCKIVIRFEKGKIVELWQQAPDFLYLLGKLPQDELMLYPVVVKEKYLLDENGTISPSTDSKTLMMSELFKRMNDCFLGLSSLSNMKDIQHPDMVFYNGDSKGSGIQAWKTFAYALHSCLGGLTPKRLDDLYVRQGDWMSVCLRASSSAASPTILQCADGLQACLKMEVVDGKIKTLLTHPENYLAFLDTNFVRHKERLANLFHGRLESVNEPDSNKSFRLQQAPKIHHQPAADEVAVIGMAGLFPQCDNVDEYWQALLDGSDLFGDMPADREYKKCGSTIARGGYVNDVDQFDARYFKILPEEAKFIDPQQRLLLEQVIQCIQDSGHPASDFGGERTGLFVCTQSEDYKKLLQDRHLVLNPLAWGGNETAMFPPKIARFLNIQGPVHFINSECASSLVALHEASKLIKEGVIDQAIVGASNLLLHPYGFAVREENLLTPDAHPHVFGKQANGQIRSEAIVSVILKSLSKAERDSDHIYGLIAGSAVNNSGKTLSLAAGSVQQQSKAITDAWNNAQVGANDISLIECHASGVRGGDYTEVMAIKAAFKASELEEPCAVASVKGNIGHCEAASGLTTLVKALLQIKHQKLVGTKNLDEIDPEFHIDQKRLNLFSGVHDWKSNKNRTVGLNSFAVGGYNAHVVVKEHCLETSISQSAEGVNPNEIIVISAQSVSSLEKQLINHKNFLLQYPNTNLASFAYTLQAGRETMKHRVAVVAESVAHCVSLIDSALVGESVENLLFKGNGAVKASTNKDVQAEGDLAGLANLWASGQKIAWQKKSLKLLTDLPCYPFDRKRFWLPEVANQVGVASSIGQIHPLLQENRSSLFEQCYWTKFDGSEFFISDHKVKGIKILPGVAYLEMIRVAVEHAVVHSTNKQSKENNLFDYIIKNIVWVQPIAIAPSHTEGVGIKVKLFPLDESMHSIGFEVCSSVDDAELVHCQGQVVLSSAVEEQTNDLDTIKARCHRGIVDSVDLYTAYQSLGLDYGQAYQGVDKLYLGDSEVLAKLTLHRVGEEGSDFALHPCMMDSAVHASIGLLMDAEGKTHHGKLPLPFAVEQVEIFHPCSAKMWAWVCVSPNLDGTESNVGVQKLDIVLMDESGRLCVRMSRFSSRTGEKTQTERKPEKELVLVSDESFTKVLASLKSKVAELLMVSPEDIDVDEELNELGFDSIHLTSFGNELNELFSLPIERPLNPTIFFEYPTLKAFSGFLLDEYPEQLAHLYGDSEYSEKPTITDQTQSIPLQKSRPQVSETNEKAPASRSTEADIAIIGMSGCFPMADNLDQFWQNLSSGKNCISQIPADRWDWQALFGDPLREDNKTNIKWGGFIDGVGHFDPLFFGISPREAELMDPQQRLLMMHVWQALEDAGYSAESLSGSDSAIFVGTANSGYGSLLDEAGVPIEGATATGMVPSVGPNRMSFFLNWHGPSEPIETACSSSLVAINRAVEGIRNGNFDMAVVGGVNTIITPQGHIGFGKAGMLAPDGRCKTFSDQADGYVRGEGVGMLVLKSVESAEKSGDHIYAVIKASAENHGGRANALTAPNPKAQAELLKTAYAKANIDPESIGYFETHGTGTKLGDPVEVNAMKAAFHELYPSCSKNFCGIGSVKSNVGHLELAAGVAGVIKVVLQLKHQTIAKTLHCDQVNPYINLAESPFYVVQENRPWIAAKDKSGRELPRRAGVSSFGFGGVNAHVVVEEYIAQKSVEPSHNGPYMIVLSARNELQLQDVRKRLSQVLSKEYGQKDMLNIAYTLQVGREAFDTRLAIVAKSFDDLINRLSDFENSDNIFYGQVKSNAEAMAIFEQDEDLQRAIQTWIDKGKLDKLCALWVKGLTLDWRKLYPNQKPSRVSLPTYPFASKRYWVPKVEGKISNVLNSRLHPLIHTNTSDFMRQRYTSIFTGEEFFLADHIVMSERILPAVAYLEMVRFAFNNASDGSQVSRGTTISQVVWPQPMSMPKNAEPKKIHIDLVPKDDGHINFELFTIGEKGKQEIHCKGQASATDTTVQNVDIQLVKARCIREIVSSEQVYAAFASMKLNYGPAHRGIEKIFLGDNELLAEIRLPQTVKRGAEDFVLHPSIFDSALQACVGFMLAGNPDILEMKPPLPFRLKKLDALEPCRTNMWAIVNLKDSQHKGADMQTLDIKLCDDKGKICVQIEGFTSRFLPSYSKKAPISQDVILQPTWLPVENRTNRLVSAEKTFDQKTLIVGGSEQLLNRLMPLFEQSTNVDHFSDFDFSSTVRLEHIVWIAPTEDTQDFELENIVKQQEHGVVQLFRMVKSLLAHGYANTKLKWTILNRQTQTVFEGELADPTHSAIAGFMGSLAKENPAWNISVLDLPRDNSVLNSDTDSALSLHQLFDMDSTNGEVWAHRKSQWYQQKLLPFESSHSRESLYKENGVYVVIGGAGGIGEVWSEYMIRTYRAQIIWIGRRPQDAGLTAKLEKLLDKNMLPVYISADASDKQSLQSAYDSIKATYGRINGVVHSAVVLHDQTAATMDEDKFKAVLSAKVDVSVRLAQVFEPDNLDFVMFFSSLVAFGKPPGQSNYVAGCQFKDALAKRLSMQWPCAVKVMNWGYWGSTGVGSNEKIRQVMTRLGIGSIEAEVGMGTLEKLLSSEQNQLALVNISKPLSQLAAGVYSSFLEVPKKQNSSIAEHALKPSVAESLSVTNQAKSNQTDDELEQRLVEAINQTLGEALKVSEQDIDSEEPFSSYGLDSVTGVSLTQTLNDYFELDLDVTLFFDYVNVQELGAFLLQNHREKIAEKLLPTLLHTQNDERGSASDISDSKTSNQHLTQEAIVEKNIIELLSVALKVETDAIDPEESFSGYGLDSVTGVQLAQTLNESFTIDLDVTVFFDYDSVRSLSHYIIEQHPEVIEQSPEVNIPVPRVVHEPTLSVKSMNGTGAMKIHSRLKPMETSAEADGIAIVGMSGSFPKADDIATLWENLQQGRDCIERVPSDRWDWKKVQGERGKATQEACFQWGGFMNGVDLFDADFFGVSEQEASFMSPQQRLLLTHAFKAVEEAGESTRELAKKATGVFIGSVQSEYLNLDTMTSDIPLVVTGLSTSMIPNRISFFMNLHGPSEHYDTACSSTFTALHRAIQSIRQGECEQAIVGAVNLLLSPAGYIGFESMDYLSSKGKMAAFGAEADGFVRSEAVGAVLLKPVKQAIADGNHIHAVIKGTGLSHGGSTVSMTTPNGRGMKQSISQAYVAAGVEPESITYVEAHGISNPLGDAIEMSALKSTYAESAQDTPCYIGHSKAAIGYPEVASGMVALFKVIMALQNKKIPGTAGFSGLHQNISLKNSAIKIDDLNRPWPQVLDDNGVSIPRRAAINNFGFSGVCGHMVLEEYIEPNWHSNTFVTNAQLFIFSAKTSAQLAKLLLSMKLFVAKNTEIDLADFAWTLQMGREAMECRVALLASSYEELMLGIEELCELALPKNAVISTGSSEKLEEVARQWVEGEKVDWQQYHRDASTRRRLSVPGYPLEQKRFWVQRDNSGSPLMNKIITDNGVRNNDSGYSTAS